MSIFQNQNTKWVRIQMSKQQKMSRLSKTSTFYETLSWLNKKLQKLTFQRFLLRLQSFKKTQNKSQIHILDCQTANTNSSDDAKPQKFRLLLNWVPQEFLASFGFCSRAEDWEAAAVPTQRRVGTEMATPAKWGLARACFFFRCSA